MTAQLNAPVTLFSLPCSQWLVYGWAPEPGLDVVPEEYYIKFCMNLVTETFQHM
jgi:hypothetical protein